MRNKHLSLRRFVKLVVLIIAALFILFLLTYSYFTIQIMNEGYYEFFEIEEA